MAEVFDYDVFLSFSSSDEEMVKPLWQDLSLSGLRVFWSDSTLKEEVGNSWFDAIQSSLERSRHMLLVCTKHSMASRWVKREYTAFLNHCHRPGSRRLIPLLAAGFEPSALPLFLRELEAGRFDDPASVKQLIKALGGLDVEALKAENAALASQLALLRRENSELKRQLEEARAPADTAAASPKLSAPSASAKPPEPAQPSESEACRILGVAEDAPLSVILRRRRFLKMECEALIENASQSLANTCKQRLEEIERAYWYIYKKKRDEQRTQLNAVLQLLHLPAEATSAEMWKKHDQFKQACKRAASSSDPIVRGKAEEELAELKKAAKFISRVEARELDEKPGEDIRWEVEGGGFVEGEVEKWLRLNGAPVLKGERLFQLKTGERVIVFSSPKAGMLRIIVPAGEKVVPGTVIARIVNAEGDVQPAVQD